MGLYYSSVEELADSFCKQFDLQGRQSAALLSRFLARREIDHDPAAAYDRLLALVESSARPDDFESWLTGEADRLEAQLADERSRPGAEGRYSVNVAALVPDDVRPLQVPGEEPLPSPLLAAVRRHRVVTLEGPRSGGREVRMLLAQAVFNLPDYHDLVVACEAARRALRSGPTSEKDYSHELELLNRALR